MQLYVQRVIVQSLATNDVLEEESNDNDSDEEDDELNLITRKIKKYVEKQELLQVQRIIQKIFPQEKEKSSHLLWMQEARELQARMPWP